ncbi:dTMP kinase [Rickettsiales bacterium LUAb2]
MGNNQNFICFEGMEACGKSTQIKLLSKCFTLNQLNNVTLREPGSTGLGEQLREILLNNPKNSNLTNILLYTAARHENLIHNILPVLQNNSYVLIDRFVLSTIVYQGLNDLNLINKIKILHQEINFNFLPKLTLILDIAPEKALKRIQNRSNNNYLDEKPLQFHQQIVDGYHNSKDHYAGEIILINADAEILSIHEQIVSNINNQLQLNLVPLTIEQINNIL